MPEFYIPIIIFLIGLVAGFVDSTVGLGGLVAIPALIMVGLPPQVAVATDRFGLIGQTVTATFKFAKAGKIVWGYVPILTSLSVVGSVIGANLLLNIDPKILQKLLGILLVVCLPVIFLNRDIGSVRLVVTKSKKIIGSVLFFFIQIYAGFLGVSSGVLIFYVLPYFFGLTMIETLATDTLSWLVISVSSLLVFANRGVIDLRAGLFMLIGMALGGYMGAHVALKKGNSWIKKIFILFVVLSALKLFF